MCCAITKRKRDAKWRIDLAIHDAVGVARKRSISNAFERLLAAVVGRSELLRPQPVSGRADCLHAALTLRGLLALCQHRKNWLRDVEDWRPTESGLRRQFGSLARHLLARCDVPGFITQVWFEAPSPTATWHQKLFKHLGAGGNIRGAKVPIVLTKPMAEFLLRAPDHLSVEQALRWCQVRGLGGDARFASAVLLTELGETFFHDAFWTRTFRWLIARSKLDVTLIRPIIDYLLAHRGRVRPLPFEIKTDRAFGRFLNRVQRWMRLAPQYRKQPLLKWAGSSIGAFRLTEQHERPWAFRCWTIRELTDSRQLIDEGNDLHHCVASYARACANGRTTIWSLQSHGSLESHRVLTIEVDPQHRRIVTALGNCNSKPKPEARSVMEKWAEEEGLEIARWV